MMYKKRYKYLIGSAFLGANGDIYEITGYGQSAVQNAVCYKGKITFNGATKEVVVETDFLYESRLDEAKYFDDIPSLNRYLNSGGTNYKIFFRDEGEEKSNAIVLRLNDINTLAKVLNNMKKSHPERQILIVLIVDNRGKFLRQTNLLIEEMKQQRWLTGSKERLLAYAKYVNGYDLAINF